MIMSPRFRIISLVAFVFLDVVAGDALQLLADRGRAESFAAIRFTSMNATSCLSIRTLQSAYLS